VKGLELEGILIRHTAYADDLAVVLSRPGEGVALEKFFKK